LASACCDCCCRCRWSGSNAVNCNITCLSTMVGMLPMQGHAHHGWAVGDVATGCTAQLLQDAGHFLWSWLDLLSCPGMLSPYPNNVCHVPAGIT
jgi:hypothetical protein